MLWDQTGPKLSVPHASPVKHNGNYRMVASNEFGSVETNATVSVFWSPHTFSTSSGFAFHVTLFTENGALWGIGSNSHGQLGNADSSGTYSPIKIKDAGIRSVCAGNMYQFHIDSDGGLWAMGYNHIGQLGTGDNNASNVPIRIVDSGVVAVSAGLSHTTFVKEDGSLWGMGFNGIGQLGTGDNNNSNVPVRIVDSGVVAVDAGQSTLFRRDDGSLWGMGNNFNGQLGTGDNNNSNVPVEIVDSGVLAVSASGGHIMFVKEDGSLWGMGGNFNGNLGTGDNNASNVPIRIVDSGVVAVSAGLSHTTFVKEDGSLWGMGFNGIGQLGTGDNNNSNVPVRIVDSGVVAVDAGQSTLFRRDDGSLWGMGNNFNGQLGTGDNNNSNVPVKIWPRGVSWTEQILTHSDGNQTFGAGEIAINSHAVVVGENLNGSALVFKRDSEGRFYETTKITPETHFANGFGHWIEANEEVFVVSDFLGASQEVFRFNDNEVLKIGSLVHPNPGLAVSSLNQNQLLASDGMHFLIKEITESSLKEDNSNSYLTVPYSSSLYALVTGGVRSEDRLIINFIDNGGQITSELYKFEDNGSLSRMAKYSHIAPHGLLDSEIRPRLNQDLTAIQVFDDPSKEYDSSVRLLSITQDYNFEILTDINGDEPNELFGFSIDMNDDWLVIGAPSASVGGKENAGAIYVYGFANNVLERVAKITSATPEANAWLGCAVRLSGNTIVAGMSAVSAPKENTKISVFNLHAN